MKGERKMEKLNQDNCNWEDMVTHINPKGNNKITISDLIKMSENSPSGKFSVWYRKKGYTITIK